MKKIYILFATMSACIMTMAQVTDLPDDKVLSEDADKTLRAATSMCLISSLYQAAGGAFILSSVGHESSYELLSVGLVCGIGGVGMATNNAILTTHAYRQIEALSFTPGDSSLRRNILANIKTARTLAIIQNITPIVGVAAGVISYSISKSKSEYHESFFESRAFWAPVIGMCAVGIILSIPEIVLIEKTRNDLHSFQRQLSLRSTKYGIGVSYRF